MALDRLDTSLAADISGLAQRGRSKKRLKGGIDGELPASGSQAPRNTLEGRPPMVRITWVFP